MPVGRPPLKKLEWSIEIGFQDFNEVDDFWHILQNGKRVLSTNTPNESMARRWLSQPYLKITPAKLERIVKRAKKVRGWLSP